MFKFFKKKLNDTIEKFSKKIDEEGQDEIKDTSKEPETIKEKNVDKKEVTNQEKVEDKLAEKKEKEKIVSQPVEKKKSEEKQKTKEKKEHKEKKPENIKKEEEKFETPTKTAKPLNESESVIKKDVLESKEKKSFFGKIISKKITEEQFEELFWDLELVMLENNVSVKVIDKIKSDLKENLVQVAIRRNQISEVIHKTLKESLEQILDKKTPDMMKLIEGKKPYVICFLGINGSGKTTTIAKFAKLLQNNNKSVVLVAADTFRAAAIDQLQEHAKALDVVMIKHDYGSDPAAVAFDGIKYAKAKGIDVVLVDTAGRLHSDINLVEEMKKIVRVSNPDFKIFVGESITGNDCVEQAEKFDQAVDIDGIVLSKADIDEKGGAAISVSYVTGKPILFLGTGQNYEDLEYFDGKKVLDTLGL